MSFVDRLQNEPWFALTNLAIFGSLGYLLIDRIAAKNKLCSQKGSQASDNKQGQQVNHRRKPVHKIVFSGGPCAGKTTACDEIKKIFEQKGFKVMIVPEAAKILVESGAMILMDRLTADERIQFQTLVVKQVLHFQDYFVRLAEMSGIPSIVVCDRGTLDVQAYMGKEEFECMLDNNGWTKYYLGEKRYDEAIYMVTAAEGAESFYSLENNVARHETAEEARGLDVRTLKAWEGFSRLTIFKNTEGETFEDKIAHVIDRVHRIVGLKESTRKVQKYLVKDFAFPVEQQVSSFEVTETFLVNENPEELISDRIQKVDDKGIYSYFRIFAKRLNTVTQNIPNEVKKVLTPIEYIYFLTNKKDPQLQSVETIKSCFVYQRQFFTLNRVNLPTGVIRVLEATLIGKSQNLEAPIPNYFEIEKDVSKDRQYELSEYAKIKPQQK